VDAVLLAAMATAAEEGDNKDPAAGVETAMAAAARAIAEVQTAMAAAAEERENKDPPAEIEVTDMLLTSAEAPQVLEASPQLDQSGGTGQRLNLVAQRQVRFFLRGLARLQEHHLQDYFSKFAEVVEVNLVRDKKTQRPRGMAFISLLPRAALDSEENKHDTMADALVEKLIGEDHSIDGVALEIQEALPNPKEEAEEAAASAELSTALPAESVDGSTENSGQVEAAMDPAALEHAQAQWKMHYLAMAINASVPEVGHLVPKQMPFKQEARPPASRHALSAPGAVPKATGAPAVPVAPWRRKGPYAR